MGGVLSNIKKKVVASVSYIKRKISDFWHWLPDWVKWTAFAGAIAVIGWFAIPYICNVLYGLALVWFGLFILKTIVEILQWMFGGTGGTENNHEYFRYTDHQDHVYQGTRKTARREYERRDNGYPWYHQPNVRNSYGWDKKPM